MRSLLLALLAFFWVTPADAQSVTAQARFFPAFSEGALIGCQVGFSVIRVDSEFSQSAPVVLNGLLVVYISGERSGAMLRLGAATESAPNDFSPVARAFLVDGFRTNTADAGASFLSDEPGFRAFPFALGEVTVAVIGRALAEGRFAISYGMPGTTVDAPFEVDLSQHSDVYTQWLQCMDELASQAS